MNYEHLPRQGQPSLAARRWVRSCLMRPEASEIPVALLRVSAEVSGVLGLLAGRAGRAGASPGASRGKLPAGWRYVPLRGQELCSQAAPGSGRWLG